MMRGLFLLLVLGATGCTHASGPDEAALVEVLVELHLLEARAVQFSDVPPGTRDSILAQYGLDAATLEHLLSELDDDLPRGQRIYSAVVDSLNERGFVRADSMMRARRRPASAAAAPALDP